MVDVNEFLVRVVCITYNNAIYISDAMNGFVMQQTTFPYICAIIDDASTDGGQEVIINYLKDHFDFDEAFAYDRDTDFGHVFFARHKNNKKCCFFVVLLKENHHNMKKDKYSYIREWDNVKYTALCEGDDYWTDSHKLQRQVEYLEEHPGCCMCSHAVYWETDGKLYKGGCQHKQSCNLSTEEVIRNGGLYLATNSLVYRGTLDSDQPEWRKESMVGDFPLQILGTLRGELHFIPDVMSVYRFMGSDSWTGSQYGSNSTNLEESVKYATNKVLWLGELDKDTNSKYTKVIHSYLFMSYNLLYNANQISFWTYFQKAMRADEWHGARLFKDFLILCFKPKHVLWKSEKKRFNVNN